MPSTRVQERATIGLRTGQTMCRLDLLMVGYERLLEPLQETGCKTRGHFFYRGARGQTLDLGYHKTVSNCYLYTYIMICYY